MLDKDNASTKAEDDDNEEVGVFLNSIKGKTILEYHNYRYRKLYKTKKGTKWVCSASKSCGAHMFLNEDNEIIMTKEDHNHEPKENPEEVEEDIGATAVLLTSRKGKIILLFRNYTYRKQYVKGNKARWVCSTMKNCRGCVFTNENNFITSASEDHCHDPPKYYANPDNVLGAILDKEDKGLVKNE